MIEERKQQKKAELDGHLEVAPSGSDGGNDARQVVAGGAQNDGSEIIDDEDGYVIQNGNLMKDGVMVASGTVFETGVVLEGGQQIDSVEGMIKSHREDADMALDD